jgi:EpsI family protein
MFLVLDAGNFHNPKVCFGSSGFKIKEIGDKDFTIAGRALKARALFVERGREGFLLVYWMCIDKKRVDWLEQKAKQFFYSLINKKKAGFMVRIDAPADEKNIPAALAMIQEFIGGIVSRMPAGQADYIFGS